MSPPVTDLQEIVKRFSDISLADRTSLINLFQQYSNILAWDENRFGRTSIIRHKIETGDTRPIWQPPQRIPAPLQDQVTKLLDMMIRDGVIRPLK